MKSTAETKTVQGCPHETPLCVGDTGEPGNRIRCARCSGVSYNLRARLSEVQTNLNAAEHQHPSVRVRLLEQSACWLAELAQLDDGRFR